MTNRNFQKECRFFVNAVYINTWEINSFLAVQTIIVGESAFLKKLSDFFLKKYIRTNIENFDITASGKLSL